MKFVKLTRLNDKIDVVGFIFVNLELVVAVHETKLYGNPPMTNIISESGSIILVKETPEAIVNEAQS